VTEVKQRHRVGVAADQPPGNHTVVHAGSRELGILQCMAWPEIRPRTYEVAVVDGEIEVAL
jgi:hypothetical protein